MTKYGPLEKYLSQKALKSVPMTFSEIESVIGETLPPSARKHRAWWSNNPSNSVITYAWLAAGYKSSEVNLEGERVVFLKTEDTPARATFDAPLLGCLAGTVTLAPGVDLTAPADPEWADLSEAASHDA